MKWLLLTVSLIFSAQSLAIDTDGDGVDDAVDVFPGDGCASIDTDGDGMPDVLEMKGNCLFEGFESFGSGTPINQSPFSGSWYSTTTGHTGGYSAYEGDSMVNARKLMLTRTFAEPMTMIFYYRNAGNFGGSFHIDNNANSSIGLSNGIGWKAVYVPVPAGTHTFSWTGTFLYPCGRGAIPCDSTLYVDDIGFTSLVMDDDDDNDGVLDVNDAMPLDTDNDGIDNNTDIDDDNDGVVDTADRYPFDSSRYQNPRQNTDTDVDSDVLVRSASTGSWTRYSVQNNTIIGSAVINAPTSSDSVYVAQLDANGDGDADILTRSASTGAWTLSIVENGAVTSSVPLYLYANLGYQFVGVGDFNNDGVDDVMLRHATNGYRVFLLQNHAVSSSVYYNAWTAASSVDQGIGDFNGDGTDDLLVRRTSDNLYFIFKTINGEVNNYYCACNIWANTDWTFQFAGDTNKDGIDDIIIRGTGPSADGKWWAFRMNNFSSSLYTNLNLFINKTAVTVGAVGDYNGDGTIDVLTRVNNAATYVSPINNGTVGGNYLLYNFTTDQVIGK